MITAYFWKDNQVVTFTQATYTDAIKSAGLANCYCIDVTCDSPGMRYGMSISTGWISVPFMNFPKEFKVHLLLLGVPL